MDFGDVELKRLYSTLQRMEAAGLVASDGEHVGWPTRRRYEITAAGERHLEFWAKSFAVYRDDMDRFLQLHNEHPGAVKE